MLLLAGVLLSAARVVWGAAADYIPSTSKPPPPLREFRGAWVATVGNIDWPSKAGLTTAQQKAELLTLLDRALQLHLNAILLQVRPGCDAFYRSTLEPWSEYLTGVMGRAPSPSYDPLDFAVEQAHARGLELHAWFNPFRARHTKALSPVAASHVSRTHPSWVKPYGAELWLDPGEEAVLDYSRRVILDVVRRYNIDGVHLDDYFYPYPEKDARGRLRPFPDWGSWKTYLARGGKLSREDWRRHNVDRFIQDLYEAIKVEKPLVKFGISPFGIWRPGFPAQIKGFDAYDELFADSRKWLNNGWLDYLAPQLYWSIEPREQSYPALLKWWAEQNLKQRHLWPGDAPGRVGPNRAAAEIVNQVRLTRQQPGASGNIHWSMSSLMQNRGGVAIALLDEAYQQPALIPASPWLDATAPARPALGAEKTAGGVNITWGRTGAEQVWLWVVQTRNGDDWHTELVPGREHARVLKSTALPSVIAVTAVARGGNAGTPAVLELAAAPRSAQKNKIPEGL